MCILFLVVPSESGGKDCPEKEEVLPPAPRIDPWVLDYPNPSADDEEDF